MYIHTSTLHSLYIIMYTLHISNCGNLQHPPLPKPPGVTQQNVTCWILAVRPNLMLRSTTSLRHNLVRSKRLTFPPTAQRIGNGQKTGTRVGLPRWTLKSLSPPDKQELLWKTATCWFALLAIHPLDFKANWRCGFPDSWQPSDTKPFSVCNELRGLSEPCTCYHPIIQSTPIQDLGTNLSLFENTRVLSLEISKYPGSLIQHIH